MWKGMHFVSEESGTCFFKLVYGAPWWNLYPQIQPSYSEMKLADMISVSENKYNQYKHTKVIFSFFFFFFNILLNKSLWPPYWRQLSFQPWNISDPMIFLSCLLVPFQYSINIYCTMANTSSEVISAAQMKSWLSKDQFICHGKLFMNIQSAYRACYF